MSGSTGPGRYVVVAALLVTGLAVLAALLLPGVGTGPTAAGRLITDLHRRLLLVAVPLAVLVEGIILYAVWRFRNNDDPVPTPENRGLELTWTVATGLVLLYVGLASYLVLANAAVTPAADPGAPEDAAEIQVTGQQWYWSVTYPEENVSISRPERIVLPANRSLRITVGSEDVIHSFHAPKLGLKRDAMPGEEGVITTTITRTGEYRLYCAEYCGHGHASMKTTIAVVPPEEYDEWLDERRGAD